MTVIVLDSEVRFEVREYRLHYFKIKREEDKSITRHTRIDSIIGTDGNSLIEVLRDERAGSLRIHIDSGIIPQGSLSFEAIWGEMDGYIDKTPVDYPIFIIPTIYKFKGVYIYQNGRIFMLKQKEVEERRIREIFSEPSCMTFMFGEYGMSVVLLQKSLEGLSKSFGRFVLFLTKPEVSSEAIGEILKNIGFFENKDDYKSFGKLEKLIEMYKFFDIIESQLLDNLKNVIREAKSLNSKIKTLRNLRNRLVHFPNEKWLTPILLRTKGDRVLTVEEIIENLDPLFELLLNLVELALRFLKEQAVQEIDEYEEAEVVSELESVISELRMFMPSVVASKLRFLRELYLNMLLLSLLDFEEIRVIR